MSHIETLRARVSPDVREAEPLAKYTTFRIGGPADYFLDAKTTDQIVAAVQAANELGLPWFVVGGGSNMLVSEQGFRGLMIRASARDFTINDDGTVTADAGAVTGLVSTRVTEAGFDDFQWAVGVPGTIGGAVRGNAGCYGGETGDRIVSVLACKDGEIVTMTREACDFAYRSSAFKKNPRWVVLRATFKFDRAADVEASKAQLRKILLDRKEKQPVEYPTAGCMFVNWRPESPEQLEGLRRTLDLNGDEKIPLTPQGTVPAGWIVDRAQLKGTKVGHVEVSAKHGNFFITDGKASSDEVVQLTAVLKTRVRNITDGVVQLHEEVEYVGF